MPAASGILTRPYTTQFALAQIRDGQGGLRVGGRGKGAVLLMNYKMTFTPKALAGVTLVTWLSGS